jgi:Fe-S-cluster containining protein
MPLSLADIDRLLGLDYTDFTVGVDEERRLRNLNGACFFLEDHGCRVYEDRPEGCRLYPLILGKDGAIGLDGECSQVDEFTYTGVDVSNLRELVNRIKRENVGKL